MLCVSILVLFLFTQRHCVSRFWSCLCSLNVSMLVGLVCDVRTHDRQLIFNAQSATTVKLHLVETHLGVVVMTIFSCIYAYGKSYVIFACA